MNIHFSISVVAAIIVSSVFLACNKDEKQAENSIEGVWDVVEINSSYGEFFENGFNLSDEVSESGALGNFTFMPKTVDFEITRNDTLYSGSESWEISAEKVNAGFTKVTKFTLTIDNHFLFQARFEDETKNAEKNAKRVTFMETPTSGFGVLIELFLEKR